MDNQNEMSEERRKAIEKYGNPDKHNHVTRFSLDASTYDEICVLCGAVDGVPVGMHGYAFYKPCPVK